MWEWCVYLRLLPSLECVVIDDVELMDEVTFEEANKKKEILSCHTMMAITHAHTHTHTHTHPVR